MTRSEIFKAAHRLAKEIRFDNPLRKYKRAFKEGLNIVYHNLRLLKEVKTLSTTQKGIILGSKGSLVLFNTLENKSLLSKIEKFAYKSWQAYENHQLFFSDEMLNAIKN